jgi:hypothetical protein
MSFTTALVYEPEVLCANDAFNNLQASNFRGSIKTAGLWLDSGLPLAPPPESDPSETGKEHQLLHLFYPVYVSRRMTNCISGFEVQKSALTS